MHRITFNIPTTIKLINYFLELNSTKATESSSDKQEDVLYQKDVSFSAELEIAPSNRFNKNNVSEIHIDQRLATLPTILQTKRNYTYTGEIYKEVDGLNSLIEDGVSEIDLNIIAERDNVFADRRDKVTTLGPSLEQKVRQRIRLYSQLFVLHLQTKQYLIYKCINSI